MPKYSLSNKLEVCNVENKRFATDACKHYFEICNLCGEQKYCKQHGCKECGLKKDENHGSLSVLPDDERLTLLIVEEQRANLKAQKRSEAKKVATRPVNYYRTLYLQDILDENALNQYQV